MIEINTTPNLPSSEFLVDLSKFTRGGVRLIPNEGFQFGDLLGSSGEGSLQLQKLCLKNGRVLVGKLRRMRAGWPWDVLGWFDGWRRWRCPSGPRRESRRRRRRTRAMMS